MTVADIQSAIRAELDATPEFYDFRVHKSEPEANLWRVHVQPGAVSAGGTSTRVVLDETFDGSAAWWAQPTKGAASVLVVADEEQLVLKDASTKPPGADQLIRLYPPRYLDALLECWKESDWANRSFKCLQELRSPVLIEVNPLSGHAFPNLRRAQRNALKLVRYSSGFLWGPPGTGKTTAIGVMLAEYLHVNPAARVLLLSATNHAVDLAMVSVDKALQQAKREQLRQVVKRIGTRFIASNYQGREHLLPVIDKALIVQLAKAERERPLPSETAAYSAWADEVERLRREVRNQSLDVIRNARLVGMTTTRAIFDLSNLRELPIFDLVVFDEASQVGLAHSLALMPLGRCRLFAGDWKQLSPVVRSELKEPQHWMARSAFAERPTDGPSVCMLDEQSRMAEPICHVVSDVFYEGKLRVARRELSDPDWHLQRRFSFGPVSDTCHISIHRVGELSKWSQQYQGPIRFESAKAIATLVSDVLITTTQDPSEVIVITPFRAQRAVIRKQFQAMGVKAVKVNTVHRSQGSEMPIVIFDPVAGDQEFLRNEEGKRLINVALSRAQAKIILFLSQQDLHNPVFSQIDNIVRLSVATTQPTPIGRFFEAGGISPSAIGQRVVIGPHEGEVSRCSNDGRYLYLINAKTGVEQCFEIRILLAQFKLKQ